MLLKAYLKKKKITMLEFAARIDVNVSTVSRICRGVVVPSRSTMQRIFDETDGKVQPSDLVQFNQGNGA
ncbi:helix-turn-helix domain-containing protein [Terasakiella pusilla]|uniref:helix-turn-helix domain-containing protein n=1 Tax=Terasakiella pusilla TaxID=64973 RepID=UPI00048AD414|nr:helix-turn-helix transcriptional regulator [Terasakiella pusilla]